MLDRGIYSMMTEGVDAIPAAFGSMTAQGVGIYPDEASPFSQFEQPAQGMGLLGGQTYQFDPLVPANLQAGMVGSGMIPGQPVSFRDPILDTLMQQYREREGGPPLSAAEKWAKQRAIEKAKATAKWTATESELEKQLGDKGKAVSILVAADVGDDPLQRSSGEIEALAERTNEARANRRVRDERIEKAGGLQNLLARQVASSDEIQTTLPDGTVIKESPSEALGQNRFPGLGRAGILDMTNVDENGDLVIEDQATDQAAAGALDTLGEDVPLGLKGTERISPLGEQTDTAAARAAMDRDNVIIDAAGNVTQAGQAGMAGQIGQAAQAGQIGFLGTESRDPYTAIPGLEEYFDPTMIETPAEVYRKQRLGDISGVPLGVLLDPNLQNALSRGFTPTMGRFLLQQALQTGADFPGGELGMGTTEAFQDFLEENQRLATADYRTGYSDLADYLRMLSQPQALEGMPPAQLARWASIFGEGTDDQMKTGILQMSIAALGVPPGMGSRAYNGLERIYDVMITRYGEIAGRAQFTNWVASAYPVPYKNVAQNQVTKEKVITNAVTASGATNNQEVNNVVEEIAKEGMQPERALAVTGQDVYAPTPEEAAVVPTTTDQPAFETDVRGRVTYTDRPKTPEQQQAALETAQEYMQRQATMIGGMPQAGMPGLAGDLPSPAVPAGGEVAYDPFTDVAPPPTPMNIPTSLGGQYGEDAQGVYQLRKDGAKTYLKDPATGLGFGISGNLAYTIGGTPTTNRIFNIGDYSNLVETLYPTRVMTAGKQKRIDYSIIPKTTWETKYPESEFGIDPYKGVEDRFIPPKTITSPKAKGIRNVPPPLPIAGEKAKGSIFGESFRGR